MTEPFTSIIMRSYNEAWALKDTLPALLAQTFKNWELIVIDSGSTDGSQDLIRAAEPAHFVQITPQDYNPGRVMNQGMALAKADTCIFLNADATPQGPGWLEPLVRALQYPKAAAVFGRQIARPDCWAVYASEYDRCFGPQRSSQRWDHFFSMVSSGLRRDVWSQRGFREDLQYAEDDEYTRWCRARDYDVVYVPDSVVMHSHNYTPEQAYKRAYGDAFAIGKVWEGSTARHSWPRSVLLGLARDLWRDGRHALRTGRASELGQSLRIRWNQRCGKYAGMQQGLTLRDAMPSGAPAITAHSH
jgi:rhamnosyltransferase